MLRDLFFDIAELGLPDYTQPIPWIIAALWLALVAETIGLVQIPNLMARGDLEGIVTAPFGHAGVAHLTSNTIALTALLFLYFRQAEKAIIGLAIMAIGSGALYWLFGPPRVQSRGASGVAFSLGGWWMAHSLATGRVTGFAIGTFILFAYSFFEQMNPFGDANGISLTGHFWGFVAGVLWALWSTDVIPMAIERYV